MKIKAIDIARELGISKATVSLALNNKPGVSEATRQEILECKARLEEGRPAAAPSQPAPSPSSGRLIRVVIASRDYNSTKNLTIDLRTPVLRQYEADAKKYGFSVLYSIIELSTISIEETVRQFSEDASEGIILNATDLKADEVAAFEKISKPLVVYDNVSPNMAHHSVMPNNQVGVADAVRYLADRGRRNIQYLAHSDDIYHFESRRRGYHFGMKEYEGVIAPPKIITLGSEIEECHEGMLRYLDTAPDADAYICENYQVSIGVMQALQEREVKMPEEVAVIGVDELPPYMTGNRKLTSVVIPHVSRAHLAILLLLDEIENEIRKKSIIYTDAPLNIGNTT